MLKLISFYYEPIKTLIKTL